MPSECYTCRQMLSGSECRNPMCPGYIPEDEPPNPSPAPTLAAMRRELIASYEGSARTAESRAAWARDEGFDETTVSHSDILAAEARLIARALRDSMRLDALRPFLRVGETDGEEWGLWCIAPSQEGREDIHAIHSRDAVGEEEEAKRDAWREHWGPDVDGMLDEMVARRAARLASGGES